MRRHFLFVAALLAGAVPSVALAVVRVDISVPTSENVGGGQLYTFEVFAMDLDGSDERLAAYTVGLDGLGFSAGGVRFVVPEGPTFGTAGVPIDRPYVFKDLDTVPPIQNFGSTATRLQAGAGTIAREDEVNIDGTHSGLLRFSVFRPATAPLGSWTVTLDPTTLDMAGLGDPIVVMAGTPGVFTYIPEPSAATLLLAPSLALLRRRRPPAPSR